jgi:hypothetical protein
VFNQIIGTTARTACALTLVLGFASLATAQEKPAASEPAEPTATQEQDPGVLAGPKVEKEAQKPSDGRMMRDGGPGARREQDEVPFMMWMTALRGLGLSDEQRTSARTIADEFRQAQREFQRAHGQEMRELMQQMREAREGDKPPRAELRQKMQKLEQQRPNPAEYQSRIWKQLTEEQQAALKSKLEEMRKEMAERREKRRDENAGRDEKQTANPAGDKPVRPKAQEPRAGKAPGNDAEKGQPKFRSRFSTGQKSKPDRQGDNFRKPSGNTSKDDDR